MLTEIISTDICLNFIAGTKKSQRKNAGIRDIYNIKARFDGNGGGIGEPVHMPLIPMLMWDGISMWDIVLIVSIINLFI